MSVFDDCHLSNVHIFVLRKFVNKDRKVVGNINFDSEYFDKCKLAKILI